MNPGWLGTHHASLASGVMRFHLCVALPAFTLLQCLLHKLRDNHWYSSQPYPSTSCLCRKGPVRGLSGERTFCPSVRTCARIPRTWKNSQKPLSQLTWCKWPQTRNPATDKVENKGYSLRCSSELHILHVSHMHLHLRM